MIVPVFVSAWEMDCCQPDATVGEEWSGCLFLYPPKPWWVQEGDRWGDEPHLGVIELDVDVLRSARSDDAMALADASGLRLGVKGLRGNGRRRVHGRVLSEWHGPDPDGVKLQKVARGGLVRRVRLVPIEFERRGQKAFYPVAQLASIDVRSTSERRRNYMDASADRHYEDDLASLRPRNCRTPLSARHQRESGQSALPPGAEGPTVGRRPGCEVMAGPKRAGETDRRRRRRGLSSATWLVNRLGLLHGRSPGVLEPRSLGPRTGGRLDRPS